VRAKGLSGELEQCGSDRTWPRVKEVYVHICGLSVTKPWISNIGFEHQTVTAVRAKGINGDFEQ
jgi:hypothetical protein